MRSTASAQYFAGFPIGFNVAIGGVDSEGRDTVNPLSMMLLKAQEHIGLSQPNLTARLWKGSPDDFVQGMCPGNRVWCRNAAGCQRREHYSFPCGWQA